MATSQKLIKTNLIIPTSTQRWSEQKQPSKVDRNKSFREVKNRKEIESTQLDSSSTSGPGHYLRTWAFQRVANDKYPSSDSDANENFILKRFCAMNDNALKKEGSTVALCLLAKN